MTMKLKNIDNIIGSKYDDILSGNERDNLIKGGEGNDVIDSRGGNDIIYGNTGSDKFIITPSSNNVTVMDFEVTNFNEKIDFTSFSSDILNIKNLEIKQLNENYVQIRILNKEDKLNLLLYKIELSQIREGNFLFAAISEAPTSLPTIITIKDNSGHDDISLSNNSLYMIIAIGTIALICVGSFFIYKYSKGNQNNQAFSSDIEEGRKEDNSALFINNDNKMDTDLDEGRIISYSEEDTTTRQVTLEFGEVSQDQRGTTALLSIDAMMDPKHVKAQNVAFLKFGNNLLFATKELSQDVQKLLFNTKTTLKKLLIEDNTEEAQAVTIYQESLPTNNIPFTASHDLMISLLSARQIVEYIPLIKHFTQSTINHLSYNVTLPEALDNKAALASAHLILGNIAAQMLPAKSISTGLIVSNLGTGSFAMRLIVADYLANQEVADNPWELMRTCGITMLAYTVPNIATYIITKITLPEVSITMSGYDVLASSSLGTVQCYNNYKAYKAVTHAPEEPTTADVVVPYIADAVMLLYSSKYLNFDSSNTANLMISIKNTMSVAATTYAAHCFGNMFLDLLPQETKEEYLNPAFSFAYSTINEVANTCYQSATDVGAYIAEEISLIMEYVGISDLKEDV